MKRERLTQIVLVIVGLFNLALIYFLYMDLRHSSWLLERKNECEPMFLSFFIPVGVFLLVAARRPAEHRSMIALAAWWNISHGVVMAIQTVEAWIHGVHRNFTDVIVSNLAIARPDQLRFARKSFMDCRAAVLIGSIPFSQ